MIVIGLLLFCEVLNQTGLIRRIALWFLTQKMARQSPWGFTFMFLVAAFVVALFMGIYSAISGVGINWLGYMAIALPVVILIWISMFLFMRYVVNPT